MNILVLCDNYGILDKAAPIFQKRNHAYTFSDSKTTDPCVDHKKIIEKYDMVFSLHCKRIFPPVLVNSLPCINIHPGFSPWHRGMFPHVWSLIDGKPAGVTIHQMDEGIDTGKYYYRVQVDIKDTDTSESLYNRIIETEMELLDATLDKIIEGTESIAYTATGNYNSLEDYKKLCEIDPDRVGTFREFINILRALSHGSYNNAKVKDTDIYLKLSIHENIHSNS